MAKEVRCPKCDSSNFAVVSDGRKVFSFLKCILGILVGILFFGAFGLLGGLLGFLGAKGEATFACHDCGNSWKQKL